MSGILSARAVATLGDGFHKDGGNLYLRVGGNRRSWIFRFVRSGKATEIGLGPAPAVSLKTARRKAQDLRELLAEGKDPLAERRAQTAAQARRKTFAEVAAFVIKRERAHWGPSNLRAWERSLFVGAKPLADLDVADVSVEDIKAVVMAIVARGDHVAARLTLSRIGEVLSTAIANGWRTTANAADWAVFKRIVPKREKADRRHPMIPWREAPAAFAALRADDAIAARCIELVALTGVRLSEAREAKWGELDLESRLWTIPAPRMKMREPHVVPLSPAAIELLMRLKTYETGPRVFPGRGASFAARSEAWKANDRATEGKGSPHGWRSTFRSWAADHGVDRETAEACLAHKIGGVEGAYNRAAMIERRAPIMEKWAAFLTGEASTDVIPFKRGS